MPHNIHAWIDHSGNDLIQAKARAYDLTQRMTTKGKTMNQKDDRISAPLKLWVTTCNQCGWQWRPRSPHPVKCPNPKCQATDWDGAKHKRRQYTKSWTSLNEQ